MKKLLAKHDKEMANLQETRAEEKENQEKNFKVSWRSLAKFYEKNFSVIQRWLT